MCSGSHRFTLRDPSSTTFPSLDIWAEQHLTALYTASQANVSTVFNNFISNDVKVTFNGASLSRADYEQQVEDQINPEHLAVINIQNIVQIAAAGNRTNNTQDSGAIGMFYSFTFLQDISERKIQSALNVFVSEDESIDSYCGEVDQRRVISLDQVLLDQAGGHGPVGSNTTS